jgi:hypothetical protein
LIQVGTGVGGFRWVSRLTAMLFGVASALTLDEFALSFYIPRTSTESGKDG